MTSLVDELSDTRNQFLIFFMSKVNFTTKCLHARANAIKYIFGLKKAKFALDSLKVHDFN